MGKHIEYKPHKAKKQCICDVCGKLIMKGEWYVKMKLINSMNDKFIVKHIHFDCRPFNCTEEKTNVIL